MILFVFRKAGRKDQKFRLVLESMITPDVSRSSAYNVNIVRSYLAHASFDRLDIANSSSFLSAILPNVLSVGDGQVVHLATDKQLVYIMY